MIETSEIKYQKSRTLFSFFFSLASLILLVCSFPTIIFIIFGGYDDLLSNEVYSISSSNNNFAISVSRRVGHPIISPINPIGIINVSLKDQRSNIEINSIQFEIHEFSELTKPTVNWSNDEVEIQSIEYHKDFSFKFRLPK